MADAGYNGEELTFQASDTWINQKEVAEVMTSMLQEVGLNVNLQMMDTTSFREQVYFPYRNEELYLDALGNSFFDPWIVFLSEESDRRERSGWSGPAADKVDGLVRAAAQNMNKEERAAQYQEIQRIVVNDEALYVPALSDGGCSGHERSARMVPAAGWLPLVGQRHAEGVRAWSCAWVAATQAQDLPRSSSPHMLGREANTWLDIS